MTATVTTERRIDPDGMSRAQLAGRAYAGCDKRWPRPRVEIGVWLGGGRALVCPDCAGGLVL